MQIGDVNNTVHAAEAFIGKIERDWWLSSFSALSRNLKHKGVSTPDRRHATRWSIIKFINADRLRY